MIDYIWYFEVASFLLSIIMLTVFILRRPFITRGWVCFVTTTVTNALASLFNILTVVPLGLPNWALWAVNILYLGLFNFTVLIGYWYVLGSTKQWKIARHDVATWHLTGLTMLALICTSPLTGWIFTISGNGVYRHGPLFPLLFVASIGILLYNFVVYIRHRRRMSVVSRVTLIIFEVVPLFAIVFENIFKPWLIGGFVTAALLTFVYTLLENPDNYLFHDTYCYNDRALAMNLERFMHSRPAFNIFVVHFDRTDYLRRLFGNQTGSTFVDAVSAVLRTKFNRDQIYAVTNACFAVISDHAGEAEHDIDRIRRLFDQPIAMGDTQVVITPTIGVIRHPGIAETASDLEHLIQLFIRQLAGSSSDRVVAAAGETLQASRRQSLLVDAIRRAIQNQSVTICYQPIRSVESGTFPCAEANVRLNDEILGRISTEEMVITAERTGLMLSLGEIIIRKIFEFWQREQPEQYGLRYLEVNLSGFEAVRPDLVEVLYRMMNEYGIPRHAIAFEVTETATLANDDMLARNMKILTADGIRFAMDDYGNGYSNINRLTNLPFSIVKIDKNLLWAAMKDHNSLVVLRNMVTLLKDLQKLVVIEGVENNEMRDLLDTMVCDFYQGYLYSRPLEEKDFIAFLREHQNDAAAPKQQPEQRRLRSPIYTPEDNARLERYW